MLEWRTLNPDFAFVAPAPLFGSIRVERYGTDEPWEINYSVPGYCAKLVDGQWPSAASAKLGAEELVAAAFTQKEAKG
jgi:hypothetical protein